KAEISTPEQSQASGTDNSVPKQEPEKAQPPKPENPAPQEETTQLPETAAPESTASETQPAEQPFDIGYWISFAQGYAESIGLRLESSATACWDNPIPAGAHCIYIERDIKSRLNFYAKNEDITDVWIWYESTSSNTFEIYVGYA
ncbi:MAG: hypothetical protein Q4C12_09030, partial [Clostridia bacterium]|nr:hypothetical protein [Clostridia bacterium]